MPWLICLLLSFSQMLQPSPRQIVLYRVICLDVSGSMSEDDHGESKLSRSISAIRDLLGARPPGSDSPVSLVTFNHESRGVLTFTDPASLNAHLATLNADGGTKIELGLTAAAAEIDLRRDARSMELILISDFLDDTFNDAREAEILRDLNGLLSARVDQGLSNTVFIRLWDTDEAARKQRTDDLIQHIAANGAAKGVDLVNWERVPVQVETRAQLLASAWESNDVLRVTYKLECHPVGNRHPLALASELRSDRGGVLPLRLDGQPAAGDLLINITANEINAGFVAPLVLAPPPGPLTESFAGGEHDIAVDPLTLDPIPLPRATWTLNLTARATTREWRRLATDLASVGVEVGWQVDGPFLRAISIAVSERGGATVSTPILIDRPAGSTTLTLSDRMIAGAKTNFELIFTPDPDSLQSVKVEPVDLETVAPSAVAITVEEVVPAGVRRLGSKTKPHGVVEGAAPARTNVVEVNLLANSPEMSEELIKDLLFEVEGDHAKSPVAPVALGEPVKLELAFPRRAGLWSYDQIEGTIRFHPRGKISSVVASPASFRIVREPIGVDILALLLGGAAIVAICWAVVKGLRLEPRPR